MRSGATLAGLALAAALVFAGVAAAQTSTFTGEFAGQPGSNMGMTVKINGKGNPTKVSIFSFSGAEGGCTPPGPPSGWPMTDAYSNIPVSKEGGKFKFEGTFSGGGEESHLEGTFKPNIKKVTGELDHSALYEGGVVCSFENLGFTAKKS